jgi:gas vesicle protein
MEKKTKIVGAGIGLAAVAAAAAYFFGGKRGEKNREKVAAWADEMKEEVLEKLKDLKHVNQESYDKIVDETASRYRKVTKISAAEIKYAANEVKKAWSHISQHLHSSLGKSGKAA